MSTNEIAQQNRDKMKTSPGEDGDGRREILYDGYLYDVTDFVKRHPGGREIIGFYTQDNEDATIPIQQFHARSEKKVLGIMKSFKRRPITEIPDAEISAEEKEIQAKNKVLTEDFTKLYLELKAEGLFEPSYSHIFYRMTEMIILLVLGLYIVIQYSNPWIKFLGCFVLSMAQGRAGWIMHEGGHLSLTGKPRIDRLIQVFCVGVMVGWSGIYWRRHHNLHHAMTQRIKRDIDLDLSPVFLLNINVMEDPKMAKNLLYQYQIYFTPILSLLILFYQLVWETGRYILKYRIPEEIFAIGVHFAVSYYYLGFWPWFITNWMGIVYAFFNFGLSHTHLPVTNKPTHWVEYGLVHTVDVEHRPWCDWWMGYLNYQIEHHLFPTMPQFRNKLAVERVRALAQKHGLPYQVLDYKEACIKMVKNVLDVSQQVKKLGSD